MDTSTLTRRFNEMPRAVRWLVVAVAFVALFQLWYHTAGSLRQSWVIAADEMEADVEKLRKTAVSKSDIMAVDDTIIALGPAKRPEGEGESSAALSAAVTEILKSGEWTISDDSFDDRRSGRLDQETSQRVLGQGKRIGLVTGDFKFTATPEDTIAIIAEFERHEEIESITAVSMTKADRGRVDVRMSLEVWVLSTAKRS